jgi:hypothetical protein
LIKDPAEAGKRFAERSQSGADFVRRELPEWIDYSHIHRREMPLVA